MHARVYFIRLFDCSVGIPFSVGILDAVGDLSSVPTLLSLPAMPIYLSNLSACGFNYIYKYICAAKVCLVSHQDDLKFN